MTRRPQPSVLLATLLAALLSCTAAQAQLRYLGVADVREVYNSRVLAPDEVTGGTSDSWDMVTEVEPGLRLYLARPRTLLSVRYAFVGQLFARTTDPQSDQPLLGYSNTLLGRVVHLLSRRTEFAASNMFRQGTENATVRGTTGADGVYSVAPLLTSGVSFISDDVSLGFNIHLSDRWSLQPSMQLNLFVPYDIPEAVPGAGASGGATVGNRVLWALPRSQFRLDSSVNLNLDRPPMDSLGLPAGAAGVFPETWYSTIYTLGAGWRFQITDFLISDVGGGLQYYLGERLFSGQGRYLFEPDGVLSPMAEASLMFRRGRALGLMLGYSHGWTRQNELGLSTSFETDRVGLTAHWGISRLYFHAEGAFLYLRPTSRTPGGIDETTKALSAVAGATYTLTTGVSLEASYRLDGLVDRPAASADPAVAADVYRHRVSIGVSLVWPPPPPQETRLTQRESEYEPMFGIGSAAGDTGGDAERSGGIDLLAGQRRPAAQYDETGRRVDSGQDGSSIDPETPPRLGGDDPSEPQPEDQGYRSWPR